MALIDTKVCLNYNIVYKGEFYLLAAVGVFAKMAHTTFFLPIDNIARVFTSDEGEPL